MKKLTRHVQRPIPLCLLVLFLRSSAAPAQQPAEAEPEPARYRHEITVETAEGFAEELDRAAPSATVIGRAEIEASEATTAAELLRRVAGVDVSRSGSPGRVTTARIGGASSAQTLVLLDGMELNSPTLGVVDLADLTLDDVERIEIVRGPMSALYGSQAMGGVIHLVSRRGAGRPVLTGELSGGSFGSVRGAVRTAGAAGRLAWSLGASRATSDGRRYDTPGGPVEHDAYDNTTVSGGIELGLGDTATLAVDGRVADAGRDLPIEVFGRQVFDVNSTQDDRLGVLGARLGWRLGRIEPSVRFGYSGARQDFADPKDPGEEGPFASDYEAHTDTDLYRAGAGVDVTHAAAGRLSAGFEWERGQGTNRDSFGGQNLDRALDTWSGFVQDRVELGPLVGEDDELVVTAGIRLDDVESFGATVSPKLSLLWRGLGGQVRLRGGAARGFRAPSLNELYFPGFGNPDLEPEVSRTYDLGGGVRLWGGRLDAEARIFRSSFDDLIDPASFPARNIARARITGVELSGSLEPTPWLWLKGSYTYQDAEDRAGGEELLRRPRHKGALTLLWERRGKARLLVDLIAAGESRDPVAGFPEHNPGWARIDLAGSFTLPSGGGRLELFGRVENLLDRDYSEVTGFPAPGINGRAGLRARL